MGVGKAWARVPRVTAEWGVCGPHLFVPYRERALKPCSVRLRASIEMDFETPMWKLSHHQIRLDLGEFTEQSCVRHLLRRTREQVRPRNVEVMGDARHHPACAWGERLTGRHVCRPSQR